MDLKCSIDFTLSISPFLKVCIYIVIRSVIDYREYLKKKMHITAKLQKTEFDKCATSGVSAFNNTSI